MRDGARRGPTVPDPAAGLLGRGRAGVCGMSARLNLIARSDVSVWGLSPASDTWGALLRLYDHNNPSICMPFFSSQTHPPILVAEDSDDDFFFFRRAARTAGLENPILRFRDGSELISFLENYPAESAPKSLSLLFVDLAMPVMSGLQVLQWLKDTHRTQFLPIVLSGSKREEDMAKAFDLGAEEYLVKPLSPAILAALILRAQTAELSPAR
jgi:CheY-like chemotaxis protein